MLRTNVKAFFKYKEYRRHLTDKIIKKDIYIGLIKILVLCIIIGIAINSSWISNFKLINQVSIDSIFSLEKFLENNYLDKGNLYTELNEEPIVRLNIKKLVLDEGINNVINDTENSIEIINDYEKKYNEVLENISLLENENKKLIEDNIQLQNILKMAAIEGIKPRNYEIPPQINSRSGVLRGEYLGKFTITSYTPSKEECGNDKGLTYSGHPIVPGVTVAVDTSYWPIGTVFYVEGLGYVMAMDTGGSIKGRNRMDFAVLDKEFAKKIGKREFDVYLIEKGNGKVQKVDF